MTRGQQAQYAREKQEEIREILSARVKYQPPTPRGPAIVDPDAKPIDLHPIEACRRKILAYEVEAAEALTMYDRHQLWEPAIRGEYKILGEWVAKLKSAAHFLGNSDSALAKEFRAAFPDPDALMSIERESQPSWRKRVSS
jgi:hypothetical protein